MRPVGSKLQSRAAAAIRGAQLSWTTEEETDENTVTDDDQGTTTGGDAGGGNGGGGGSTLDYRIGNKIYKTKEKFIEALKEL